MIDETSNRMEKVRDPVCGMRFRRQKAVSVVEHHGEAMHFCTNACRRQFDQDPEPYVGGGPRDPVPPT